MPGTSEFLPSQTFKAQREEAPESGQIRALQIEDRTLSARRHLPRRKASSSLLVTRCQKWVCLLCSTEHLFVKCLQHIKYLLSAVGEYKELPTVLRELVLTGEMMGK